MSRLTVIACHFNPCGYQRPVLNYLRWRDTIKLPVITVELTFGRPAIYDAIRIEGDLHHLMWQKEALLNVALRHVDTDAVAWIDTDVLFTNPHWVARTLRELEDHAFVQLFSDAYWMCEDHELKHAARSTGWRLSRPEDPLWCDFTMSHPGFAWAARTEAIKKCGLYAHMITGSGDTAMIRGFTQRRIGQREKTIPSKLREHLLKWAVKCEGTVGFVEGACLHMYHGELRHRRYVERWEMLNDFDPETHVVVESSGALAWTRAAPKPLKTRVFEYFAGRREDGTLQPVTA